MKSNTKKESQNDKNHSIVFFYSKVNKMGIKLKKKIVNIFQQRQLLKINIDLVSENFHF